MAHTAHPLVAEPADPAIALADALQSGFAAQRSGHQRSGHQRTRPTPRKPTD